MSGGEAGAVVLLRHVSIGVDQVAFLFVQRPDATYGVPPHTVESANGVIRVRVPGARLRNPDGTSSYWGERSLRTPGGRIRGVTIDEAADGTVTIELEADGGACPRVASRRSGLSSTFSAAFVSVALRDGPVVALDPDRGPIGYPMQVVGMGFRPSSPVAFHSDGRVVWDSRSDARGWLDTVVRIPQGPPGRRAMLVRDASGAAQVWYSAE